MDYEQTNPLMMAISLGKIDLVRQFLSVIPDVNDEKLCAWGYRQPYTVGHMLLDPNFPRVNIPVEVRLAMIDLLVSRDVDFNIVYSNYCYTNPALAAGEPSGRKLPCYRELQARALIYGADPTVIRSSFTLTTINISDEHPILGSFCTSAKFLLKQAYEDYISLLQEDKKVEIRAEIQGLKTQIERLKNSGLKRHRTSKKVHLWNLISDAENRLKMITKNKYSLQPGKGNNRFTLTKEVSDYFAMLAAE